MEISASGRCAAPRQNRCGAADAAPLQRRTYFFFLRRITMTAAATTTSAAAPMRM